ncbi:hypothetical protein ABH905_002002 [Pseudomonas frederiksbergensis]
MTDIPTLREALLAVVPADGNTIGNQLLLERLHGQFPLPTEEKFWIVRDGLIEEGGPRSQCGTFNLLCPYGSVHDLPSRDMINWTVRR